MFTTAVKGSSALRCVGGTPGSLGTLAGLDERSVKTRYVQPIKFPVMSELEDELINDAIDTDCATDEIKGCVCRIIEDKVIPVEGG